MAEVPIAFALARFKAGAAATTSTCSTAAACAPRCRRPAMLKRRAKGCLLNAAMFNN